VTVDPGEHEFLAQFLGVTAVRLDVDRPLEEERLVETVQLVLNRLRSTLSAREFLAPATRAVSRVGASVLI